MIISYFHFAQKKYLDNVLIFQMSSYTTRDSLYLFGLWLLFSFALNGVRGKTCPITCSCEGKDIRCNGSIPNYLPIHIENVILYQIDADNFVTRRFCSVSWSSKITQLAFIGVKGAGPVSLADDVFNCLNGLQRLQLTDRKFRNFTSRTFNGLINLSTLDLSGCRIFI